MYLSCLVEGEEGVVKGGGWVGIGGIFEVGGVGGWVLGWGGG